MEGSENQVAWAELWQSAQIEGDKYEPVCAIQRQCLQRACSHKDEAWHKNSLGSVRQISEKVAWETFYEKTG